MVTIPPQFPKNFDQKIAQNTIQTSQNTLNGLFLATIIVQVVLKVGKSGLKDLFLNL
jgi:hypothetical protein